MRYFRITFFRLKTSFLERDINEKFWKKFQMFPYVVSINGIDFTFFHWFFNEWENNNEIAGTPDFKLEYLAHTNWSEKSASGFLFCEPITTRVDLASATDHFFFCNTVSSISFNMWWSLIGWYFGRFLFVVLSKSNKCDQLYHILLFLSRISF